MNNKGEINPKSKFKAFNKTPSIFNTAYFVTLYIYGTKITKLAIWGIKIYSYFVAIKSAVIPNNGSFSKEISSLPSALSTMLTAEKHVYNLNWNLELKSNIHVINLVRLDYETLLGSAINFGTYSSSFSRIWPSIKGRYSFISDVR